jgi:hypothetical protein
LRFRSSYLTGFSARFDSIVVGHAGAEFPEDEFHNLLSACDSPGNWHRYCRNARIEAARSARPISRRKHFPGLYILSYFLAPVLLLAAYGAARLYVRRNVEGYSTAPQYEPPAGLSPAAMRYVTRGVVDGTSVAATLASLVVRGYVEMQAKGASFAFWRMQKCDNELNQLPAEEAAIAELLFDTSANIADPACGKANEFRDLAPSSIPDKAAVVAFGPSDARIKVMAGVIYTRVKPALEGKYFTRNAGIILLGILATLVFGLAVLPSGHQSNALFLTIWSFFFFQGFSVLTGLAVFGKQRMSLTAVAVSLAFVGTAFVAAHELARNISWVPVASYFAMIVVNGVFVPLLHTPTAAGQKLLFQIRGYETFLRATELDRMNEIGKTSASMPKMASIPYAIALDLKEPWGQAMANTFASVIPSPDE